MTDTPPTASVPVGPGFGHRNPALRDAIKALPLYTLVNIGWEIEPGRVQGSLYMRTRDGIRYVGPGRDDNDASLLSRETDIPPNARQPQGFKVVAAPVASGGSS